MSALIYPLWFEIPVRILDAVILAIVVAGHIKLLVDGAHRRPETQTMSGPRTILVDGKPRTIGGMDIR